MANRANTGSTRRMNEETDTGELNQVSYYDGAAKRTRRFAESTQHLRDVESEIQLLSSDIAGRPTGVLSGGDADIAYHYLGLGVGILATLYTLAGSVFALSGGGAAVLNEIVEQSSAGLGVATSGLLNLTTGAAVFLQVLLTVIMVGTRRNVRSWPHLAALITSAALTYAGWSSVWLLTTTEVAAITTAVPASLIGGAIGWILLRACCGNAARWMQVAIVAAGIIAGVLGDVTLIHFLGILLAWSADQVARKIMVIG